MIISSLIDLAYQVRGKKKPKKCIIAAQFILFLRENCYCSVVWKLELNYNIICTAISVTVKKGRSPQPLRSGLGYSHTALWYLWLFLGYQRRLAIRSDRFTWRGHFPPWPFIQSLRDWQPHQLSAYPPSQEILKGFVVNLMCALNVLGSSSSASPHWRWRFFFLFCLQGPHSTVLKG